MEKLGPNEQCWQDVQESPEEEVSWGQRAAAVLTATESPLSWQQPRSQQEVSSAPSASWGRDRDVYLLQTASCTGWIMSLKLPVLQRFSSVSLMVVPECRIKQTNKQQKKLHNISVLLMNHAWSRSIACRKDWALELLILKRRGN